MLKEFEAVHFGSYIVVSYDVDWGFFPLLQGFHSVLAIYLYPADDSKEKIPYSRLIDTNHRFCSAHRALVSFLHRWIRPSFPMALHNCEGPPPPRLLSPAPTIMMVRAEP